MTQADFPMHCFIVLFWHVLVHSPLWQGCLYLSLMGFKYFSTDPSVFLTCNSFTRENITARMSTWLYWNSKSAEPSSKTVSVVNVPRVREDKAALNSTIFAESIPTRLYHISTLKRQGTENWKWSKDFSLLNCVGINSRYFQGEIKAWK